MSDPLVPIGDGLTSISPDEQAELIPTYIANRGELFAAEQANIAQATLHLSPGLDELVDDHYLRQLHLAMFVLPITEIPHSRSLRFPTR